MAFYGFPTHFLPETNPWNGGSDTTFADALNESRKSGRSSMAQSAVSAVQGNAAVFRCWMRPQPDVATWLLVARVARCEVRWFFFRRWVQELQRYAGNGWLYIYIYIGNGDA